MSFIVSWSIYILLKAKTLTEISEFSYKTQLEGSADMITEISWNNKIVIFNPDLEEKFWKVLNKTSVTHKQSID